MRRITGGGRGQTKIIGSSSIYSGGPFLGQLFGNLKYEDTVKDDHLDGQLGHMVLDLTD